MRLKSAVIFVVCAASFLVAGCGGTGTQTCVIYDQGSAVYISARGPVSSQEARAACAAVSRKLSKAFGTKWTTHKNPKIDYSHDVRSCRKRFDGGELDIYDKRSGLTGDLMCVLFKRSR